MISPLFAHTKAAPFRPGCILAATGTQPTRHAAGPRESGGPGARLAGRRILLVEDEVLVAMEIEDALEAVNADVVGPAHDLPDAARLAAGAGIDAAILDVDIHGEPVFPVAEALQAASVPFLFHTGHADRATLRARFGDVMVCRKPTLADELLATLARIVPD